MPEPIEDYFPGDVLWVDFTLGVGREQAGRRPAVVLSGTEYNSIVDTLLIVVPVTTTARGWPNHVPLTGPTSLSTVSLAMTEQTKTISRQRILGKAGQIDSECLALLKQWVADFLEIPLSTQQPLAPSA